MSRFQEEVIKIVLTIPKGKVTNYGTVATLAGIPRGARLVGSILHYAIDKPGLEEIGWHRIINRHGFISTKCFDHPRELQKVLLEEEGVVVSDDFMVDLEEFSWIPEKL